MKILSHKLEELDNIKYNTLIEIECDCCHSTFKRMRKIVGITLKRGSKHLFCSHKCVSNFHKFEQKEYTCKNCNAVFYKTKNIIKNELRAFCSRKCYIDFKKRNAVPKHLKYKRVSNLPKVIKMAKIKKIKVIKEKRISKFSKIICIMNCHYCNKEMEKSHKDIIDNLGKNLFCSKSCRMTFFNLNTKKTYGCRKSYAETFLTSLIKDKYPNLEVRENVRDILDSKLELDIYIPSLKLAIELNGPVHYFPIYGEGKLKNCQDRDIRKQIEIQDKKLNLMVVNISKINTKKKTEEFLTKVFNEQIINILK